MRTTLFASVLLMAGSGVAAADPAGVYDVKFEEVSTNCTSPLRYPGTRLTIKVIGKSLTVDIDRTPLMSGVPSGDKVSAKSKAGGTMVEGMTGVFSVAGKVSREGQLQLVMVGEYSANGRPLCTQSWNVNGPRVDSVKKKAAKPAAKAPKITTPAPFVELVALARF